MNNFFSRHFSAALWILFLGFLFTPNDAYAQTGIVSVDFKNSSPQEIIKNLESRTPYRFVYQNDIDLSSPRITLKKESVTIDEVLTELQLLTNLNFKKNNNNIAINRKEAPKKKKGGGISGKVVDNYGKPVFDAMITAHPSGDPVFTNSNGDFVIELLPGTYNVEITAEGFANQLIENIPVQAGESTPLNVALKVADQDISLDEVVIVGQQYKSTASTEGLLMQQKKSAQFSDGISSEQIARTPDNEVGSTLKRITGITTVDDKYVVVRSMGERWNQAVMDGVNLPSTDPGQQNFAFDIIPTSMVESVVVSKTATPDMYANFAGGYVEVKTKSIPKEDFTTFSVGTSYNSRSTFKDQLSKQRGKYDYFGFDDGRRDYPKGITNIGLPATEAESGPFLEQSRRFTEDNFTTYKEVVSPNTSLQFTLGRAFDLKNNNRWGFVGSLQFRNTQSTLKIDHTERGTYMWNSLFVPGPEGGYSTLQKYGFKNSGASYTYNSTLSGMFNAGIQLGNHRITMRNTLIHIYESQLTQITGWNYYGGDREAIINGTSLPYTRETNYPVYQTFLQNKLEGNHRLGDVEVNWFAAYANVGRDTKDATFLQADREKVGDDVLMYYSAYNNGVPFPMSRANYTNSENDYNFGTNINWSFTIGPVKNDIKAGYFGTYKRATNQQENVSLKVVGGTGESIDRKKIYVPLSEFLDGSYYNWGGFGWEKTNKYGNKYEGEVKVHSPFLMLDNKIGNYVRLVWGIRAESFVYKEISNQVSTEGELDTEQKDDKVWQYLPSVNLTVSPTERTNIRLGYNKSVLRPQFSERLKLPFYDPLRNAMVYNYTGGVISSIAENYDAKIEWFPSLGQVLSLGIYHKKIANPIEAISNIGGDGGSRTIYNMNSHSARLWGVEAEILKNLTFLGEGKALEQIYLYANGAINSTKVTSYVNLDGTGGLYEANRPLFGQSPYTYNLGIDYIGDRITMSIRHNASGDQYLLVGYDYDAEEIRMPYAVTDAQISYKFFPEKNLELRCGIKNMFDRAMETYNNKNSYTKNEGAPIGSNPRDQFSLGAGATDKYDENIDRKLFKAWSGRTLSLTLNYSF